MTDRKARKGHRLILLTKAWDTNLGPAKFILVGIGPGGLALHPSAAKVLPEWTAVLSGTLG